MENPNKCKFCRNIEKDTTEFHWEVRSTMLIDNIYEYVKSKSYEERVEDYSGFGLTGTMIENNLFISIDYEQKLINESGESVVVSPFSEILQINFCPFCGKQVSETLKPFKDISDHIFSLIDEHKYEEMLGLDE